MLENIQNSEEFIKNEKNKIFDLLQKISEITIKEITIPESAQYFFPKLHINDLNFIIFSGIAGTGKTTAFDKLATFFLKKDRKLSLIQNRKVDLKLKIILKLKNGHIINMECIYESYLSKFKIKLIVSEEKYTIEKLEEVINFLFDSGQFYMFSFFFHYDKVENSNLMRMIREKSVYQLILPIDDLINIKAIKIRLEYLEDLKISSEKPYLINYKTLKLLEEKKIQINNEIGHNVNLSVLNNDIIMKMKEIEEKDGIKKDLAEMDEKYNILKNDLKIIEGKLKKAEYDYKNVREITNKKENSSTKFKNFKFFFDEPYCVICNNILNDKIIKERINNKKCWTCGQFNYDYTLYDKKIDNLGAQNLLDVINNLKIEKERSISEMKIIEERKLQIYQINLNIEEKALIANFKDSSKLKESKDLSEENLDKLKRDLIDIEKESKKINEILRENKELISEIEKEINKVSGILNDEISIIKEKQKGIISEFLEYINGYIIKIGGDRLGSVQFNSSGIFYYQIELEGEDKPIPFSLEKDTKDISTGTLKIIAFSFLFALIEINNDYSLFPKFKTIFIDDLQNLDDPTTLGPILSFLNFFSENFDYKIIIFTLNENLMKKRPKEILKKWEKIKVKTPSKKISDYFDKILN